MNDLEFARREALLSRPDSREPGAAPEMPPFLTQVLTVARRRKWIVLGCIAGMLLLGLIATLLMTPQYSASSTIEIRRETTNVAESEGAQAQIAAMDQEFYNTQYGLLRSRSLAERVATDLGLFDNERFFRLLKSKRAADWFRGGRPLPNASTRDQRIREAGELLLLHFDASAQRLSRLVDLRFTSPDPELSRQIADAWSSSFIQLTLERRIEGTSYARTFLEQRLALLRRRIDESERLLVAYAGRENIINLPAGTIAGPQGSTVTTERSIVADDLANLNGELDRATADRIRAQSRLGSRGGQTAESLQNDAISGLRQRRAEASAEYARMMVQFEPDYPPARALQSQIQELDRAIAREESRVGSTLEESYRSALARERELRGHVDQLQSRLLDLRRRSIQYNIYQRDADTNRQLYDALLQRYKEIGVAGGVGVNNISIVDRAALPERPSSPKLLLNIALALLAGIGLGAIVAFALEQVDQGIKDPDDVESSLGVPLLGTIPKLPDGNPLDALADRKSSISEAYVSLLTSLSFSTDHGVPKSLAVCSTRPAEGKTTTAYALARSLARSQRRVLLIDGDMRSPSIHHLLGIEAGKGLSNYLSGSESAAGLPQRTDHDGLSVMTAGPQPPSAPELLASDRFRRLLAELADSFDHVIVDSPPVMGLADAPLISSHVEGTIFVVQSQKTHRNMARTAIERLLASNGQLIGAVLTKFDARRAHFGYGYDYGYGYGYGEGDREAASA